MIENLPPTWVVARVNESRFPNAPCKPTAPSRPMVAVSTAPPSLGSHQQGDHPRLREIDFLNWRTGLIDLLMLRERDLPQVACHQLEHVAGQTGKQPIILMALHRTVGQLAS